LSLHLYGMIRDGEKLPRPSHMSKVLKELSEGELATFIHPEGNLHYYDFAAGSVIIKEAGGIISNLDGGLIDSSRGFIASNGLIHPSLLSYF
jgi:fructose-1,6-bisphosphatase/inositol monophosphatase family enzyme